MLVRSIEIHDTLDGYLEIHFLLASVKRRLPTKYVFDDMKRKASNRFCAAIEDAFAHGLESSGVDYSCGYAEVPDRRFIAYLSGNEKTLGFLSNLESILSGTYDTLEKVGHVLRYLDICYHENNKGLGVRYWWMGEIIACFLQYLESDNELARGAEFEWRKYGKTNVNKGTLYAKVNGTDLVAMIPGHFMASIAKHAVSFYGAEITLTASAS